MHGATPDASGRNIVCTNVPVGTYKRVYRNTVEMSENSENHLKAIVRGRQAAERNRVRQRVEKVAEKAQRELKATEKSERGSQSLVISANCIDVRARGQ